MTSTDFKPNRAKAGSSQALVNFFMGTNAEGKHLEEAFRQQLIEPGERLLGFFDGLLFDPDGKRVGGIALHDYLIVTDRQLIMWARDQFKDYVDRFPLSHSFVQSYQQKDMLHGTIRLGLVLPSVANTEVADAEQLEITFDLVPMADLKQLAEIIEVAGNVHRDLIAGDASEADRYKATWVLFNQVFVGKAPASEMQRSPSSSRSTQLEPMIELIEDEEGLAELMTPLSRLDNLDSMGSRRNYSPAAQAGSFGQMAQPRNIKSAKMQSYGAADSGGTAEDIEAELNWLSGVQAQGTVFSSSSKPRPAPPTRDPNAPPGVRLKQDLNPEGLYKIGRAGRTAWDGLDKLRREAESKMEARGNNVIPMLKTLRDSGMNLKDITEFVDAVSTLLDTVNQSPAAREMVMTFLNRSPGMGGLNFGGSGGNAAKGRSVPEVEDVLEDEPTDQTASKHRLKVERRGANKANSENAGPAPRYKVAIRKKSDEATAPETAEEVALPVQDETGPVDITLGILDKLEKKEASTGSLFQSRPSAPKVRLVPRRSDEHNN